ncbi:MAG TPA: hypothetical protein VGB65_03945 [Allosphingosinicella sp.]|jgi:hypothetical protein
MEQEPDSQPAAPGNPPGAPRPLIGEKEKHLFLDALAAGSSRKDAARLAGFNLNSFYNARKRDGLFLRAWLWITDLKAAEARIAALARPGPGAPVRIAPQGNRLLQRRRMPWLRFTEARQQAFLDHFAGTADAGEAAAVAGVTYEAVRIHYRKTPEFAAAWDEALSQAYVVLEAEAVRQRLAAQRRFSENLQPTGEMAQEFERVMKLLARWDRKGGGIGPRPRTPIASQQWTFEDAMIALDKRLRALGLRDARPSLPPPEEHE